MMAEPITAEPKVTTKPNNSSPSAVPGDAVGEDQVAQAARIERQQAADHERRQRHARGEVDREQPEQRHAEEAEARGYRSSVL